MNELSLFNRLFDDVACGIALPSLEAPAYSPAVDVRENKDSYELTMDLPGRTQDDVELSVKENVLTIASLKQAEAEQKEEDKFLIRERRSRDFKRSFTMPRNADMQQISASFKNGVLTVTIPYRAELAERKIAIRAA